MVTETVNVESADLRAGVDFICLDDECDAVIEFNVMELEEADGRVVCPQCRREYQFDQPFVDKLRRLRKLILAVQECSDILGDVNVAVQTPSHEVRIPYNLLLTRLNTIITLEVGDAKVDFNFRIEPLNNGSIRLDTRRGAGS